MKIKSILVVGGGTSGWMSACMFAKQHPNIKVSLVESDNIDTVGVGESTILIFNAFLAAMGMEDKDWMPACHATYKNNIRFNDFKEKGHSFDYPFGGDRGSDTVSAWSQLRAHYNLPPESYVDFCGSHNIFLSRYNRNTLNQHKVLDYNFQAETAYHFDASLFGQYLRDNIALPLGVNHHIDDVVDVKKDENGYVTSVVGESGEEYSADLYVDCTGFRSRLLGQEMESEFKSYKPWLSNDRAIATHIPYTNKEKQLTNSTNCTGIDNGWVWNIPLRNRIGSGYVYSSKYLSEEEAEEEFGTYLGNKDLEFSHIKMRIGRHKRFWVKNVVAVGLSSGFIEPLESNGLFTVHENLINLIKILRRGNPNQFSRDLFLSLIHI